MAFEKHWVSLWFYDTYFLIGFLSADFADVFKNIGPRVYPEIIRQTGEIPAPFLIVLLDALSLDGDDNDFFVVRIQKEADLGNIATIRAVGVFFGVFGQVAANTTGSVFCWPSSINIFVSCSK